MQFTPILKTFKWVVVNSSGGKDSQTALQAVVALADAQGYPREQIVVSHQCLGESEWAGTKELARAQAEHYGLRFEVTSYRNNKGEALSLLDYVEKRGKWPSMGQRYCTSEFKRSPGGRVITKLFKEAKGDVLNVDGRRAQESPARAKLNPWVKNERFSTSKRLVMDWLVIHELTEAEVWAAIRMSKVPHHKAYDLGMNRLSCVFCIFAPKNALMIAGQHNPELLAKYVAVEERIGHTFKNGSSLAEIKAALDRGERAAGPIGDWNM